MKIKTDVNQLTSILNDICLLGPRWQGSDGEKKIMDYIENYLQELAVGFKKEEFVYTSFQPEKIELTVMEEPEIKIECHTLAYSGSGQIEGELVYVSEKDMDQEDLHNKIVLSDALKSYEAYPKACKAGAKGFILGNNLPGNIARVGATNYDRKVGTIPAITIGNEDTQRLFNLANAGNQVSFKVEAEVVEKHGFNIVVKTGQSADFPKIIVCSHYDSMWLGQHAFDNASGTAAILELIRCFSKLPQFNVEFLLCGAEELGFWGSKAFVERHLAKCEKTACVVCLDAISSDLGPTEIGVTEDLYQYVKEFAKQSDFQVDKWSVPPRPNSDHVAFDFLETPVFWLTSMDPYYHTAKDVVTNVSGNKLKEHTDFAANMIISLLEYL